MPRFTRIRRPWRNWDITALRRNLGVYVHIPFCPAICSYCDFLKFGPRRPKGLDEASYEATLMSEIKARGAWLTQLLAGSGRRVDSIFIGGGTPTMLPARDLARLADALLQSFPTAGGPVEFSCEANPDTLDREKISTMHDSGITRLSVGIQSSNDRLLKFMGRTHRWRETLPVLEQIAMGPISNYSFDLIYGLPNQSSANVANAARDLLAFRPPHISAYWIVAEPHTAYLRWTRQFPRQIPSDQRVLRQQHDVECFLRGYGHYRYEINSYALPGWECHHNIRYWQGGDYIGLGIGAASRIGKTVVNNAKSHVVWHSSIDGIGGPRDALLEAALLVDPQAAAPPADAFLRMRNRLGPERSGMAIKPGWITDGLMDIHEGRLEVSSRGLNLSEQYALEMDS